MSTLNFPAPGDSNPGDKVQTGDIEWTYSAKGFWYSESSGGGGFSGDYNDLINKPNIPPEFNLDEGSYVNDIIHWSDAGSVLEISTTDAGPTASGNAYTNIAATGGSGTGLTCNVIRRKTTGAHEVYVATSGENYQVGDTVHFDLGYDPANPTGSNGIDCTIDAVNDETGNGWVALPGADFFVSSSIDSLNTGVPQFMLGAQFGGSPDRRRIDTSAFPLVIEPIGDKTTFGLNMTANRDSNGTPRIQFEAGNDGDTLGELTFSKAANTTLDDYTATETYTRLRALTDRWQFQECTDLDSSFTTRFLVFNDISIEDSELSGGGIQVKDGSGSSLIIDYRSIKSNTANSALKLFSGNQRFNFINANGNVGYQIDATAGTGSFVLPADAAEPTNYDAEGEYIGPVVDQAQDIRDALTALKAAAADNGTDLAGLKAAILSALTAF